MERRTLAATVAAVFLTTAAGVLAVTANLGLLHVNASDSKVGTLSPVAAPEARRSEPTTVAPVTAATPPVAPAPDPAPLATPVVDTAPSQDVAWSTGSTSTGPSSASWTPTQAASAPTTGAPAPTTARAAEPGDRPATGAGASGDD